jgi:hypothetical protein
MTETVRKLRAFREWEVELPPRDSLRWKQLVRKVTHRPDMRIGFWTDELIVSLLISDAELTGGHEVTMEVWNDETQEFDQIVLATVRYAVAKFETVFDPKLFKVALDETEPPADTELLTDILKRLREYREREDKDSLEAEGLLRGVVDRLEELVTDRYGK